ncbi:hypothetical protein [Brachybacterium sp. GPGPB12]|uniref:hypothetical protein n=1 Tax=Brachybacterium sp. GPGPB12 TaxID=3023517 RepID=UPI0031342339
MPSRSRTRPPGSRRRHSSSCTCASPSSTVAPSAWTSTTAAPCAPARRTTRSRRLPVWRDSPSFDAVERAALLLGETVATLPEPMVRDRDLMVARDVLGEQAFAALEWSAVLMTTYNRLSVLSHHPVPGAR